MPVVQLRRAAFTVFQFVTHVEREKPRPTSGFRSPNHLQ